MLKAWNTAVRNHFLRCVCSSTPKSNQVQIKPSLRVEDRYSCTSRNYCRLGVSTFVQGILSRLWLRLRDQLRLQLLGNHDQDLECLLNIFW